MHALFIDDLSEAEAINLKKQLINDPVTRPYPLNFHERHKLVLPGGGILQQNLSKVEEFTLKNKMKINENKSKVMIFNKSRKFDFPPELAFKNGEILECLEVTKLLGIQIHSSLKWNANCAAIYAKSMSKIWLLRRMKLLKLDNDLILDYYLKEIRPLAEQGVIVWNSGLTKAQVSDIEKIQKVALLIILGEDYSKYPVACQSFDISTLTTRRAQLCENFALKLYLGPRREQFFTTLQPNVDIRKITQLVKENTCRTTRCFNAPHNYITRLVNQNIDKLIKRDKN